MKKAKAWQPHVRNSCLLFDIYSAGAENNLNKENLTADLEVKKILFLPVALKKQEFDGKIIDAIAVQNTLRDEQAKPAAGCSIDERLAIQERIVKLEKLISKTEADAWKEQQKRFELYSKAQKYKKELEELKHG